MRNLYVMGGSGSGKTTLAKNLEIWFPNEFTRTLEFTTREVRLDEVPGYDYDFISREKAQEAIKNNLVFERVQYQFGENTYGCMKSALDPNKWNVIVASIEGIFSGLKNSFEDDESVILNILVDDDIDVQREGRNYSFEQSYNLSVFRHIFVEEPKREDFCFSTCGKVKYIEIELSKLKEIRNDPEGFIEWFNAAYEQA